MWSDSQTALKWIESDKEIKDVYVSDRVVEICKIRLQNPFHLKYVVTDNNPADLLSRGCSVKKLKNSEMWFYGPQFLTDNSLCVEAISCSVYEIVEEPSVVTPVEPILDLNRFSSLRRVLNVAKWVLIFCKVKLDPFLLICKQEQKLHVPTLYKYLQDSSIKVPSEIKNTANQLNLFLDKGVIKSKGRLTYSLLEESTKTPIFMPTRSRLVVLLLEHLHISIVVSILFCLFIAAWFGRRRYGPY